MKWWVAASFGMTVALCAFSSACRGGGQQPVPARPNGGNGAGVARARASASAEPLAPPLTYGELDPSQTVIAWVAESAGSEPQRWAALVEPDGHALVVHSPSVGAEVYALQLPVEQHHELLRWVLEEPAPTPYSARYIASDSRVFACQGDTLYDVLDGSQRDQLLARLSARLSPLLTPDRRIGYQQFEQRITELKSRYAKTKLVSDRVGALWFGDAQARAFDAEMKSPLPHERETGPAPRIVDGSSGLFAYCSTLKWATCGIALDDGRVFVLSGMPGASSAKSGRLAGAERQVLADSVNAQRFFEFPENLHNPNILDGWQRNLFVASPTRAHATQNYSYPSRSYAKVSEQLGGSLERAAQSKSTIAAALAAVRLYAHDRSNDERGATATAWLKNVAELGIAQ